MKRMKKLLAALLAAVLALTVSAAAEQEARKIETPADAEEWLGIFLGEAPETLDGVWAMTAQMQSAADRMGGMKGLAASLSALGAVQEIGAAYEEEIQGYRAFRIPCVFSTMPLDLVLVTDQGAVAGLSTAPYTGGDKREEDSAAFDSIELALPVPALQGELPGTLLIPKGEGPFPAVVLVQGSGPSDRDETVMNLKPFRDLAEGLAVQGVAVYRFDKRTYVYGEEMAADTQGTLVDESIEDAVNAVQLLARQDRIDPARIWVLGHSLGGNAVPAIARSLREQPVDACGFILMAASPRPLDVLIREQYDFLYSLLPEVTPELQAEKDALFAELDRLQDPDALADDETVAGAYAPYWKWLAAYDILQAAQEISQPCLLLQGEEAYQATMEDFAIWQNALGKKANWRLISFPGLTHVFTAGQKAEGNAIYARTDTVDAAVIRTVADFILHNGTNP